MFALTHATLMAAHRATGDADEIFDAHVLACVLASALETVAAGEGTMMSEAGLDAATLRAVIDHWFPLAERGGFGLDTIEAPALEMEEEMLRDLLLSHRAGRGNVTDRSGASSGRAAEPPLPVSPSQGGRDREGGPGASECHIGCEVPHLPTVLAAVVARRAMRPDHLWQDLGLFDRSDLNRLLARHFPTLHAGNTANMRWKKYFYRRLCEAEGFSLCTAPSCAQCADFRDCFGAEDGESRMAKTRREIERSVAP